MAEGALCLQLRVTVLYYGCLTVVWGMYLDRGAVLPADDGEGVVTQAVSKREKRGS
jgi:hypothetical protein